MHPLWSARLSLVQPDRRWSRLPMHRHTRLPSSSRPFPTTHHAPMKSPWATPNDPRKYEQIEGQMALTGLWPCNGCSGSGRVPVRQGRESISGRCPTCQGTGTLEFDPEDKSEIPF